ncbi:MAG: OmpH family outer membrane protein [Nitrospirae bacterium]|nr:OmpH family outer membrane protein [Nitrospirota bacterium]
MKKTAFTAIVILAFSVVSAWGADVKIGYVDVMKALNESIKGLEAKRTLEQMVNTRQVSIDNIEGELKKLQAEMEKQASVLTPEAKKEKEEQVTKLKRDYQRTLQDSEEEIKKKESEYTQGILKDLQAIIKKVGDEEGYTGIFDARDMLHFSKKLDITEKVIKTYNESYKAKK